MSEESINDDELKRMMWGSSGIRGEAIYAGEMTVVEGFAAGVASREDRFYPVLVIRKPGGTKEYFVFTDGVRKGKVCSGRTLILGLISALTKTLLEMEDRYDADR